MAKKRVSVSGYDRVRGGRKEPVRGYTRETVARVNDESPSFLAVRRRSGIRGRQSTSRKKVYFHVTRPETIGVILSDGLKGQFMSDRIFLWDNLESARRYVEERKEDDREANEVPVNRVIIRVTLPRRLRRDNGSAYGIPGGLAVHARSIPPEFIQGVTN